MTMLSLVPKVSLQNLSGLLSEIFTHWMPFLMPTNSVSTVILKHQMN